MFSIIITIFCILFPVYFWGYALTLLDKNDKSIRFKFWTGIFSWLFSVGATMIFAKYFSAGEILPFIIVFFWLVSFFYFLLIFITQFRSSVSWFFLKKVGFLHASIIFFLFLTILIFGKILNNEFFTGILITLFLPAFFEEISKHFSMMGLLAKKFSFSLRDLTIFTFCVVLGFVFVENVLYFWKYGVSVFMALFRSFFAFSAHLLAALIAMFAWWKALAYPLVSFKYFLYFALGLLWASFLHFLYNYSIQNGKNIVFFPYLIASYGLFVYFLKK